MVKMKGIYLLFLHLDEFTCIPIGKLGLCSFNKGFYAYVGSALYGVEARVNRHFKQHKKYHWHIDYLTDQAHIYDVILIPTTKKLECVLAANLREKLLCIPHFGSSDCHCPGHLFFTTKKYDINNQITKALTDLSVNYYRCPVNH